MPASLLPDLFTPDKLFGGSEVDATAALVESRLERSSLELLAVLKVLRGRGYASFVEVEGMLRSLPSKTFARIWSSPDAYLWTRLAFGFAKDGFQDDLIVKFARWSKLSEESFAQALAERAMLIALGGLKDASKRIRLLEPFTLPIIGSLAGTSVAWHLSQPVRVFGIENNSLLVGTSLECAEPLSGERFSRVFYMPEAARGHVCIDIWSESVRADFNGLERNARVSDPVALQRQADVFSEAIRIIAQTSEKLSKEILLTLRSATPLISDGRSLPSSSNSVITGAMWYSETEHSELIAEMIVHEFSHTKVFLLQDVDPLLDNDHHGTGWDTGEFYSPWRDDPRPPNGILHAYLVFSEAALFWARLIFKGTANIDIAKRRFGILVRQLECVRFVLENNCRFTPFGQKIMAYFSDRLDQMLLPLVNSWKTDTLPVLYLERHTEFNLNSGRTIAASVYAHRERWESRYGASFKS